MNHIIQYDSNRFDDISLPDMFANTKIDKSTTKERDLINEKLNFEESEMLNE